MYNLQVFYPGDEFPRFTRRVDSPEIVLEVISGIFAEHPGCERVVVTVGVTRLFSIDCAGNRLP